MDWKNNNFDLIRIMAAILVVFSHSFAITSGNNDNEPLYMISNGQTTLGHVGVMTFFVISGYLITMSYLRHPSVILFCEITSFKNCSCTCNSSNHDHVFRFNSYYLRYERLFY
ncbi:acyltransferase family protein [Bacillus sanguinis]